MIYRNKPKGHYLPFVIELIFLSSSRRPKRRYKRKRLRLNRKQRQSKLIPTIYSLRKIFMFQVRRRKR